MPLFTIGIPTFNRPGLLAEALWSVLDQGFADWEVVMVDDAGDAPSSPTLDRMVRDPRIRSFRHETNRGRGVARQRILDEARGRWVLWLDDDDLFLDGALGDLAAALDGFDGPIAAFRTLSVNIKAETWRPTTHVGFDAGAFANKARMLMEATLHGHDASNHFVSLWSKATRLDFAREVGFATGADDPLNHALQDMDFMLRVLGRTPSVPELPVSRPVYIFRHFGPNAREDRSEEPALRLRAYDRVFSDHARFYAEHSTDPAYEYACFRYLAASDIYFRFQQPLEAWRARAEIAVAAGGKLMDLFVAQAARKTPPLAGVRTLDDPSTPEEVGRLTGVATGIDRPGLLAALRDWPRDRPPGTPRRIQARYKSVRNAVASPFHMVEGASMPDHPPDAWSVYAIDWRAQEWLMVDAPYAVLADRGLPAHADQYAMAGATKRLPWPALEAPAEEGASRRLLTLFSVGGDDRGLLGEMLSVAGCAVVHELDAFTQLGAATRLLHGDDAARAGLDRMARTLTAHLAGSVPGTGPLVLTMRSQAADAAALLPEREAAEVVLLVRPLEDWYRDFAVDFPDRIGTAAAELAATLRAFDGARARHARIRVLSRDDILSDPVAVVASVSGRAPSAEAVDAILAIAVRKAASIPPPDEEDPAHPPTDTEAFARFRAQWRERCDPALLGRLCLDETLRRTM